MSTEIKVGVLVFCSCTAELEAAFDARSGGIIVEPCTDCLQVARDEAGEEGFRAGVESGEAKK